MITGWRFRLILFAPVLVLSACAPAAARPSVNPVTVDATAMMAQALSTAARAAAITTPVTETPPEKVLSPASLTPAPPVTTPAPSVTTPTSHVTDASSPTAKNAPTAIPAETGTPSLLSQASPEKPSGSPTPDTRKLPKYWAEWPLIPTVSARAKEIFLLGQQLGNDPHSFTTIGDCQSEPNIFMGIYDTTTYQLPTGSEGLADTAQWFKGSFARDSITVKDGMSVASVFAPGWADPKQCQPKETPLDCEFRLHKPVIVFINLGTNWKGGDDVKHEEYMRRIVDYAISKGVIPILGTKGDNLEGGYRINESIARVAYDYDLPFWNFWLSIRDLPGKGIDGTRPGGYLIPEAWGRRSFTGLEALDAVWRELKPLMK